MIGRFTPKGDLQIVYQFGLPHGIRDDGGFLLFFPHVTRYEGQDERYLNDLESLKNMSMEILTTLEGMIVNVDQ